MKRILINATQNEEIRVALCKGNHLYDFDLENRTREQKKSNIYKGHVTRVEPSLEAVFVEYGSQRQGFLPIREISAEYLSGNPRDENIKKLIKEGDELIVQVEKEERGNKGAALSTYVSLAGRYLVLMPNNPRGGGISRQISGKLREDMKRMLGNLDLQKGMSVIIRTAGIGKTQEELQHDLNHLLNIWQAIQEQNQKYPSPRLVHQEAGVVTRAVRDYLRDDIAEIWIDNENAYIEAAGFIDAVMPKQADKLRKYTDYEPMFARFNVEKQIETAYQREVRLPSGGSIVIDQTEALVSIDINSAKSTKGSDVAETAYHTNLEAADEIARQLRLRDMGGLIVIDFIDMNDNKHQKEVEKRLIDATKYDRARVQFGDISKFGLMEMSRQRLRPSLEESTGYICPRCHGNGMIRDLRSLSLSIMRQIEQIALKERQGEVQAEVPTDIAAFLLNEKRDALVYLEQDSGTRITILPHAHLESPNFKLHFNRDGFAPSSYERITDTQQQEYSDLGYNVDWQTAEKERPEQQPTRQPRKVADDTSTDTSSNAKDTGNQPSNQNTANQSPKPQSNTVIHSNEHRNKAQAQTNSTTANTQNSSIQQPQAVATPVATQVPAAQPQAVAWLSNLFAQAPQAQTAHSVSSRDAAEAIEALVNTGAQSLGSFGQVDSSALTAATNNNQGSTAQTTQQHNQQADSTSHQQSPRDTNNRDANSANETDEDKRRRKPARKPRPTKPRPRREARDETAVVESNNSADNQSVSSAESKSAQTQNTRDDSQSSDNQRNDSQRSDNQRSDNNRRHSDRNRNTSSNNNSNKQDSLRSSTSEQSQDNSVAAADTQTRSKRKTHSQRSSRGNLERGATLTADNSAKQHNQQTATDDTSSHKSSTPNPAQARRSQDPNEVVLQVTAAPAKHKSPEVVHLSLDDSKPTRAQQPEVTKPATQPTSQAPVQASQKDDNHSATAAPVADVNATAKVENDNDKAAVTVNEPAVAASDSTSASASSTERQTPVVAEAEIAETEITVTDSEVKSSEADTADNKDGESQAQAVTETADSTPTDSASSDEVKKDSTNSTDAQPAADTTPATDSTAAVTLTHEVLFAKRYITAQKFGQASNDPRVVRQQQAVTQPVDKPMADAVVRKKPAAIRGSVGEFIQAFLPEAQRRLADDGIIQCFIAAMAQYKAQQTDSDSTAATASVDTTSVPETAFDFSNYGYQPLSADYLARFEAMTQPVSQFAAAQGKTAVSPRAIGQRASNDPRGQHPDADISAVATAPVEELAQQQPATLSVPDAPQAEAPITTDAQPSADAVSIDSELPAADEANSEQSRHSDTSDADASDMSDSANSDSLDDTIEDNAAEELAKDDAQAGKSKTTIASYKNMIENVAEQLLPQTGMFSLTTPKVPKARARKPKTEHKKPTQAEKLATDSESTDSNSAQHDASDSDS